jgi:hypothetical protein
MYITKQGASNSTWQTKSPTLTCVWKWNLKVTIPNWVHVFLIPQVSTSDMLWNVLLLEYYIEQALDKKQVKYYRSVSCSISSSSSSSSSSNNKKNWKNILIQFQNHVNKPTVKINTYTSIILHKFQNQHINQKLLYYKRLCVQKGRFHDKLDSTNLGLWTFGVWHHVIWWTGTTGI